jgi:hypothetical protein
MDMAICGMLYAAFSGECPAIDNMRSYTLSFGFTTLIMNLLKFFFSIAREGQPARYPLPNAIIKFLGILQLAFGIWGISLIAPNLDLFGDTGKDTCEFGPLIAGTIPAAIIACVIVGLLGYGAFVVIRGKFFKKEDNGAKPGESVQIV